LPEPPKVWLKRIVAATVFGFLSPHLFARCIFLSLLAQRAI
jgi:hypothetical protein